MLSEPGHHSTPSPETPPKQARDGPLHPSILISMPTEPSSQISTGELYENDTRTTAEQACNECRRRKSKCNRVVPVCTLCQKFGRLCNYEKQTKTPLTRRHLDEVESELVRTKALLQQLMAKSRDHSTPGLLARGEGTGGTPRSEAATVLQSLSHPDPSDQQVRSFGSLASTEVRSRHSTRHIESEEARTHQEYQCRLPGYENGPQTVSAPLLKSHSSPSNFEWDERNGNSHGERFIDGMASLTSASHEGGYLGVASGAALLRATDTGVHGTSELPYLEQHSTISDDHAPSIQFALSSLGQLEPFVDAYFSLYHRSYPIIHEATFRAQLMEVIPRPAGNAWQVLLFIVSAVGVWTTSTRPTDIDLQLFESAKARLSIDMLETGNLVLVQALTLFSNYMQKRNKPNSGYNYTGLARRIAMGIGLHKEFPNSEASLFATEMRRRIWHCLYIFDVGAIITFSRPLDFPNGGIDVALPMNVHDPDFTQATKTLPIAANETTVYTHMRAQATFHMATSTIYSKIISSPFPSASELLDMDDKLIGGWLREIPPFFRESIHQEPKFRLCHSILRWRYRNFRILMYRPLLLSRLMARSGQGTTQENFAQTDIAIQRCLDAASESVELISNFWAQEQQDMMACWYGLYFLFQAILIPVICLRNDPQGPLAPGWREQIHRAMIVLESMALLNPTAFRCLSVIRNRCGTYLDTSAEGWGHPTEESPQTQLAHLYPLMWPTLEMAQIDGMDSVLQESTIMDFMNQLPDMD